MTDGGDTVREGFRRAVVGLACAAAPQAHMRGLRSENVAARKRAHAKSNRALGNRRTSAVALSTLIAMAVSMLLAASAPIPAKAATTPATPQPAFDWPWEEGTPQSWTGGPHGMLGGDLCVPDVEPDCSLAVPPGEKSGIDFSKSKLGENSYGPVDWAVHPMAEGNVIWSGWFDNDFGYQVVVEHAGGWQTLYAHLSANGLHPKGPIYRWEIGTTSNSGCDVYGCPVHLHVDLRYGATVTKDGVLRIGADVVWDGKVIDGWTIHADARNYNGHAHKGVGDPVYATTANTAMFVAAAYPPGSGSGCDTSWVGAEDGNWSEGLRWSNGVPSALKHACIDVAGVTVTISSPATAAGLTLGLPGGSTTTLDLRSTLNATAGLQNHGTVLLNASGTSPSLQVSGGSLFNAGTIRKTGSSLASIGASLYNAGVFRIVGLGGLAPLRSTNASAAAAGGGVSITGGGVTNAGTVGIDADTSLSVSGSWHQGSGSVDALGSFATGGFAFTGGSITGTTITVTSGYLDFQPGMTGSAKFLMPSGGEIRSDVPAGIEIVVGRGSLLLPGDGFTNAGTIRTTAESGTITLDTGGGPLRNSGTITRDGFYSTIVKAGSITNKGTINATTTTGYPYRLGLVAPVIDNQGTIDLARGADFSGGTSGTPLQLTNSGTLHVSATREARVFLAGGSFTQAGGTLAIDGDLLVDAGTLRVEGGAITGNPVQIQGGGALSAAAGAPAPAASIEFTGLPARIETDLPAGFVVMVTDSPGTLTLGNGGGFTNAGTIRTVPGTGSVTLDTGGGPLRNSGTITRDGFYSTIVKAGSITNKGTINATTTTGYPYRLGLVAPVIDNQGTIDLARGADFSGGTSGTPLQLTNSGTLHVSATREARVFLAGGSFTQAGGTLAIDGDLLVDAGTLRVEGGAITGNPVQIQGGGALSAAAGAPAPAASIEFTGLPARIETDLPAGFVVMVTDLPGTLTLGNGGGFTNAGTIRTVPGTGSVTLDTGGGPLRNSGTITRDGFYSTIVKAGSITNKGTINATTTTGYPYPLWLAAPVIDNRGTIDLARGGSFGEGTTTGRVSQLTNSGTIHVPADRDATAYLAGTFTQTAGTLALDGDLVVDGGTVRVEGGAITGTGTLDGDLYNAGTVAPGDSPGILTVTGDYVQAPAGTLSVEIASLDPGDIDLLRVGGAAQIAGILKVQASGYVPVLDDLVTLIEAGAVSGSFSTIDGAAVGTGLGFVPDPTATAYRLRVVAGVAVTPFTDIAGSPFKPDIEWVYTAGITSGCTATAYCPSGYVTREQMASFLARALKLSGTAPDAFTDDEASPHEPNINLVAKAGIATGCSATKYCPGALVSREQMASFLARALKLSGSAPDAFTDDESSIHEPNINLVAKAGVATGCGAGKYCPTANVTRGQMAAFLHRAFGP